MYSCLNLHTHYSLSRSIIKPKDVAPYAKKLGIKSLAITDYNSISGAVEFIEQCDKHGIKWIIGIKVKVVHSYLTLIVRNLDGWKQLIKFVSKINLPQYADKHDVPIVTVDLLDEFDAENIICIMEDGHHSSLLPFCQKKFPFLYAGLTIIPGITSNHHIYAMRLIERSHGIKVVALPSPHYLERQDFQDHKVMLASGMQTTFSKMLSVAEKEYPEIIDFLNSDEFNLPGYEELVLRGYTEEEVMMTNVIAAQCESYKIFNEIRIPQFPYPPEFSSDYDYMVHLCRIGFRKKFRKNDKKDAYVERILMELGIIKDAGLSSYFLIVADYVNFLRSYSIVGAGRGSVGGSLIAYLLGITDVDPIEYNLLFSRFYNASRKGSMPDIDIDVPKEERENIIKYLRTKYGYENTCQVCTFNRLQGRGILKEVFRVHGACSPTESNKITKPIPGEEQISDDLQELRDMWKQQGILDQEPSIIMWALENRSKDLSNWCSIGSDGKLEGPLSIFFEQAIRLEGVLKNPSRHAAALLISDHPITDVCPMIWDKKKGELIAGIEHEGCAKLGLPKIDVLGLTCLDKLQAIEKLVNERRFQRELVNAQ